MIFVLAAMAIGISVRNRRDHLADLMERANALARDRDRQAQLARAAERSRIAREMHDVVAHSLSVMITLADGASAALDRAPDRSRAALTELSSTGRTALGDMRRVLGALGEDGVPLEPTGGGQDLPTLVERFRTAGLPVHAEGLRLELPSDTGLRLALYRVVQESLTNVLRHAPGTPRVDVVLRHEPDRWEVEVTDHGGVVPAPDAGGAGRGARGHARARSGARRHRRGRAVGARLAGARDHPDPGGTPMTDPIRVLLVDDQALMRMGFAMVLDAEDDLEVVGEAGDGATALAQVRALRPDVVLMDVRMPGMNGIEATERLTAEHPEVRVLVLTTFDLDEYAFAALRAGASGFLLKDAEPAALVTAIRTVASGEAVVAPRVTRRMLELFAPHLPVHADAPTGGHGPPPGRAHPARGRGAARRRARPVQRGDRRRARAVRGDGQDARRPDPGQARGPRPRAGRDRRLRDRPGRPLTGPAPRQVAQRGARQATQRRRVSRMSMTNTRVSPPRMPAWGMPPGP